MMTVNSVPTPGITATGVYVTYRNGQTALRDTTFEIPTGTITGLVGVNGAGKSTIFKAIMGFVPVAKGRITILGQSVKAALRPISWPMCRNPKRWTGRSPCWSRMW